MAEFTENLQSIGPSSFSFLDIDPSMELLNQLYEPHNSNLMPFSCDTFLGPHEPEFPGNLEEDFPFLFHHVNHKIHPVSVPNFQTENEINEGKKRKSMDLPETTLANSAPAVSESRSKIKHSSGRGKKLKNNATEEEKGNEVVNVWAKRGVATDNRHNLAERVRRRKINEKIKCLQNIIPGCDKTMGMAVMLDEIINYVQSLQHQVEFLSLKLTAASAFYDFSSEIDALETMQRARASELVGKYKREGFEGVSCFQPTWPF